MAVLFRNYPIRRVAVKLCWFMGLTTEVTCGLDPEVIKSFVRSYTHHRYLHRLMRDCIGTKHEQLADDLWQDIFLIAWARLDRFDVKRGSMNTWLKQIGKSVLKDFLRSHKQVININSDLAEWLSDEHETEKTILRTMEAQRLMSWLSQEESAIMVLKYYRGQSQSALARTLGCTLNTIKLKDRRIQEKLRMKAGQKPVHKKHGSQPGSHQAPVTF